MENIKLLLFTTGQIYVSSDYGNTWTAKYPAARYWRDVSISSSGQYQTAGITQKIKKL